MFVCMYVCPSYLAVLLQRLCAFTAVPSSVPSGPSLAPIGTSVDEHLTDTGKVC